VARSIGIFGPEGGPERVDPTQPRGQGFGLQLSGHGQIAAAAKKIPAQIRLPRLQSRHAEHLACAFAVRPGEHRGVHQSKPVGAKKFVHRVSGLGPDAKGRTVLVGARAQVGDTAQKFVGMAFFLQREGFRIGLAEHLYRGGAHLPALALARRNHQSAVHAHGRSRGGFAQALVRCRARIHNTLQIAATGAVIEFHKRKFPGVATGADPAADDHIFHRRFGVQHVHNQGTLHGGCPHLLQNMRAV